MKQIRKISKKIALLLSFWLFFGTVGLSVDFHYCGGELSNWGVISDAHECETERKAALSSKTCCKEKPVVNESCDSAQIHQGGCCSTDSNELLLDAEFNGVYASESSLLPLFFTYSYIYTTFNNSKNTTCFYTNEVPSLLVHEISFTQVFLI